MQQTEKQEDWQDVQTVGILTGDGKKELNRNKHLFLMFTLSILGITGTLLQLLQAFFTGITVSTDRLDCSRCVNQGWS